MKVFTLSCTVVLCCGLAVASPVKDSKISTLNEDTQVALLEPESDSKDVERAKKSLQLLCVQAGSGGCGGMHNFGSGMGVGGGMVVGGGGMGVGGGMGIGGGGGIGGMGGPCMQEVPVETGPFFPLEVGGGQPYPMPSYPTQSYSVPSYSMPSYSMPSYSVPAPTPVQLLPAPAPVAAPAPSYQYAPAPAQTIQYIPASAPASAPAPTIQYIPSPAPAPAPAPAVQYMPAPAPAPAPAAPSYQIIQSAPAPAPAPVQYLPAPAPAPAPAQPPMIIQTPAPAPAPAAPSYQIIQSAPAPAPAPIQYLPAPAPAPAPALPPMIIQTPGPAQAPAQSFQVMQPAPAPAQPMQIFQQPGPAPGPSYPSQFFQPQVTAPAYPSYPMPMPSGQGSGHTVTISDNFHDDHVCTCNSVQHQARPSFVPSQPLISMFPSRCQRGAEAATNTETTQDKVEKNGAEAKPRVARLAEAAPQQQMQQQQQPQPVYAQRTPNQFYGYQPQVSSNLMSSYPQTYAYSNSQNMKRETEQQLPAVVADSKILNKRSEQSVAGLSETAELAPHFDNSKDLTPKVALIKKRMTDSAKPKDAKPEEELKEAEKSSV